MKQTIYYAAFYIRLSREDGDNLESESIRNQRDLLQLYLEQNVEKFHYVTEYIDDGYTGSNFNRPAWQQLLSALKENKINTIITKDLSRMGRDYISMGEYIERIFPEQGIRYIAVNDDIDTLYETPGLEFLQFKLMFNDYYLKDTSKKIRKIVKTKKEKGQFLGWKAIYGYQKDPKDKHKLLIDHAVQKNVCKIFQLALNGYSPSQIADLFSREKVPTPSMYAQIKSGKNCSKTGLWCPRTIKEILTNETYIGNLTQGKRKKINYKSKKEIRVPKSEWIIIPNTHEPIIDKQTFDTVQIRLKEGKKGIKKKNKALLSGFLFCKECGHAIGIRKSKDLKRRYCYCTYYATHSKFHLCTSHSCNYDKLEQSILNQLKELCANYVDSTPFFTQVLTESKKYSKEKRLTTELSQIDCQLASTYRYLDCVYEDKIKGEIDSLLFQKFFLKYQEEIQGLEQEKRTIENKLQDFKNHNVSNQKLDLEKKIEEYLSFQNPTHNLLLHFIDKILIDQNKSIEIYYKFQLIKNCDKIVIDNK